MKLFANGFNLYKQLAKSKTVLEEFTEIFESEVINFFCIQHSFLVLQTEMGLKFLPEDRNLVLSDVNVFKITSNDERILILDNYGKLLKYDLGKIEEPCIIPNLLTSEETSEQIVNISCGSKIAVAYSNRGRLFNIPEKLKFEHKDIIDIQCGREHCLLLDKIGNVYSFGRGSRGQLGHGDLDDQSEPTLVDALAGLRITQIATGGWHSCAVSQDGDLYTWGWNSNGQLGLTKNEEDKNEYISVMATPQLIDINDDVNVIKVAAGTRHTVALLGKHQLYGCGWNKYKQLKNDPIENFYSFTYLSDFSTKEILELKCGPWHSAVLCR